MGRPRNKILEIGMRHGHLTILRDLGPNKYRQTEYECVCDCGARANLRTSHFTPGRLYCTRSCALFNKKRMTDLTGKTSGAWKVLGYAGRNNGAVWKCVCVCGTERTLETYVLAGELSESCGCVAALRQTKYHTPEIKLARKRELSRLSARKHASRVKACKIRYEAQLKRATPSWLTKEDWAQMDAIYAEARELTRVYGIRHEVDHKIPLNGKRVSGLHVPGNLQILSQLANVAKSNKYAELSGD
jgi:hypothetical protein